jgi:hypothetical protein
MGARECGRQHSTDSGGPVRPAVPAPRNGAGGNARWLRSPCWHSLRLTAAWPGRLVAIDHRATHCDDAFEGSRTNETAIT